MWKLYSDGGCKPNPGKGSYSAALYKDDALIESIGGYIGETTNNKAEYKAFWSGLQLIESHCDYDDQMEIYLDSQLVLNQVSGKWKVKDESLHDVSMMCQAVVKKFPNMSLLWVKGHSGNEGNNYVDTVCTYFIDKTATISSASVEREDDKLWLKCPFSEKDEVKRLGAKWEPKQKKWWVVADEDNLVTFAKWIS